MFRTRLASPGVLVTAPASADDYPRLAPSLPRFDGVSLPVGARVLRVGQIDTRGMGEVRFVAAELEAVENGRLELWLDRGAGVERVSVSPLGVPYWWWYLPQSLAFGGLGIVALFWLPDRKTARLGGAGAILYAAVWLRFFGGPRELTYAWLAASLVETTLALPLALRAMLRFPTEAARDGRLARLGPWVFALTGPASVGISFNWPLPLRLALPATFALAAAAIATALGILAVAYRRSGPIGRRQVKWVLYGGYLTGVFALGAVAAALLSEQRWWMLEAASPCGVFLAGGYLIGLVRFHLADVDRVISATATYSVLSALVIAGLLSCVPPVAQAASATIGVDPATAQTTLSLALAALIVPGYRLLRPRIERRLFQERAAFEDGIADLLEELGREHEATALLERVGARLDALLRPESIAIYGRAQDAFVSLVARGRALAPAFDAAGPLVATLAQAGRPLTEERWTRSNAPSAFERAALRTFDAAVLVPVRGRGELSAFLCLGAKRSGDIYTAGECALLAALGDRIGAALGQFDSAELLRHKLEMYQSLRRFVPEPLAQRIERGEALEAGEREVSVLFVDIRGYSTLAAERRAEEVFSLVSRYTRAVSGIVRRHGGTVVEFNGDGMMAVFGAPESLARKEAAAVLAALELVDSLEAPPAGERSGPPLRVGIGIATGSAYVGSIQSVDRAIWSAIGSTTNLAARLEQLTRELGASVAIDARTHAAAGEAAKDLAPLAAVRIRGREQPEDLFVLRRGAREQAPLSSAPQALPSPA
ncbi:MAG TPA: adenylate/guanylate cyclase domain-containing protein [Myxococcota bacterium]|nr:adenylate/guanylate cyclase domain-containing protein [Myxococcota bacterium]